MHDSVDVPEPPVTVAGVTAQVRLEEFVATARVTVAENPFTGARVNVAVPAELAILVTAVGLTPIAKS